MIDREGLRGLHGDELPLHVLEQDYVQALFLQELYRASGALVFEGGTFLKHAHGLDRFSEDLDFTRLGDAPVPPLLRDAAAALSRYGLEAAVDDVDRRANATVARLRYRGPLYDGSERSLGRVELDVSTRADVSRDPEWRRLFFPYPETRAVTARCLPIEEAFAEKLRALSARARGRDLYDCWFLLEAEVEVVPALFRAKMDAVGAEPTVTIAVTEREWTRDLAVLLEHPPDYGAVKRAVVDALSASGLAVDDATS